MDAPSFLGIPIDLPVIWAILVGVAVAMYVILDGFDLGIGILYPFFKSESDRDQMMNSVAPFWDGNETWLILGGNGLFVAFPRAYAVVMPALYIPVILMLLGLVFRGVAFEFRWVAKPKHHLWDVAFAGGSIVAAFSQGLILGGLLQGIAVETVPVASFRFAGGPLDWLTPFSLLCGVALVIGYALIGACWLKFKIEGDVAERARKAGRIALPLLLACIAIVSIWTPLQFERIADRWFRMPDFWYLLPIPLLTLGLALLCWRDLNNPGTHNAKPFWSAVGIFLLAYLGLVISNVPYLVPPSINVWMAASNEKSQTFLLTGTVVLLPLILAYTAFVYWVFRGKLKPGEGYH